MADNCSPHQRRHPPQLFRQFGQDEPQVSQILEDDNNNVNTLWELPEASSQTGITPLDMSQGTLTHTNPTATGMKNLENAVEPHPPPSLPPPPSVAPRSYIKRPPSTLQSQGSSSTGSGVTAMSIGTSGSSTKSAIGYFRASGTRGARCSSSASSSTEETEARERRFGNVDLHPLPNMLTTTTASLRRAIVGGLGTHVASGLVNSPATVSPSSQTPSHSVQQVPLAQSQSPRIQQQQQHVTSSSSSCLNPPTMSQSSDLHLTALLMLQQNVAKLLAESNVGDGSTNQSALPVWNTVDARLLRVTEGSDLASSAVTLSVSTTSTTTTTTTAGLTSGTSSTVKTGCMEDRALVNPEQLIGLLPPQLWSCFLCPVHANTLLQSSGVLLQELSKVKLPTCSGDSPDSNSQSVKYGAVAPMDILLQLVNRSSGRDLQAPITAPITTTVGRCNPLESSAPVPRIGPYELGPTLGRGNFAVVKLAKHRTTKMKVAIKIMNKELIGPSNLSKVSRELEAMKLCQHPHIVRLYHVMESETNIFMVTEYASRGEVFDHISKSRAFTEKEARELFWQIVCAIDFCHKSGVVHRDLKAENLLLDSSLRIKVADFGFCNFFKPDEFLSTHCGSPQYAAPELFKGEPYDGPLADVWSLGVILYILVCGSFPFPGESLGDIRTQVLRGLVRFPFFLSTACEQVIRGMLQIDPSRRLQLRQITITAWMQSSPHVTHYQNMMSRYEEKAKGRQFDALFRRQFPEHSELAKVDRAKQAERRLDGGIIGALAIGSGFDESQVRASTLQNKCDRFHAAYQLLCAKVRHFKQHPYLCRTVNSALFESNDANGQQQPVANETGTCGTDSKRSIGHGGSMSAPLWTNECIPVAFTEAAIQSIPDDTMTDSDAGLGGSLGIEPDVTAPIDKMTEKRPPHGGDTEWQDAMQPWSVDLKVALFILKAEPITEVRVPFLPIGSRCESIFDIEQSILDIDQSMVDWKKSDEDAILSRLGLLNTATTVTGPIVSAVRRHTVQLTGVPQLFNRPTHRPGALHGLDARQDSSGLLGDEGEESVDATTGNALQTTPRVSKGVGGDGKVDHGTGGIPRRIPRQTTQPQLGGLQPENRLRTALDWMPNPWGPPRDRTLDHLNHPSGASRLRARPGRGIPIELPSLELGDEAASGSGPPPSSLGRTRPRLRRRDSVHPDEDGDVEGELDGHGGTFEGETHTRAVRSVQEREDVFSKTGDFQPPSPSVPVDSVSPVWACEVRASSAGASIASATAVGSPHLINDHTQVNSGPTAMETDTVDDLQVTEESLPSSGDHNRVVRTPYWPTSSFGMHSEVTDSRAGAGGCQLMEMHEISLDLDDDDDDDDDDEADVDESDDPAVLGTLLPQLNLPANLPAMIHQPMARFTAKDPHLLAPPEFMTPQCSSFPRRSSDGAAELQPLHRPTMMVGGSYPEQTNYRASHTGSENDTSTLANAPIGLDDSPSVQPVHTNLLSTSIDAHRHGQCRLPDASHFPTGYQVSSSSAAAAAAATHRYLQRTYASYSVSPVSANKLRNPQSITHAITTTNTQPSGIHPATSVASTCIAHRLSRGPVVPFARMINAKSRRPSIQRLRREMTVDELDDLMLADDTLDGDAAGGASGGMEERQASGWQQAQFDRHQKRFSLPTGGHCVRSFTVDDTDLTEGDMLRCTCHQLLNPALMQQIQQALVPIITDTSSATTKVTPIASPLATEADPDSGFQFRRGSEASQMLAWKRRLHQYGGVCDPGMEEECPTMPTDISPLSTALTMATVGEGQTTPTFNVLLPNDSDTAAIVPSILGCTAPHSPVASNVDPSQAVCFMHDWSALSADHGSAAVVASISSCGSPQSTTSRAPQSPAGIELNELKTELHKLESEEMETERHGDLLVSVAPEHPSIHSPTPSSTAQVAMLSAPQSMRTASIRRTTAAHHSRSIVCGAARAGKDVSCWPYRVSSLKLPRRASSAAANQLSRSSARAAVTSVPAEEIKSAGSVEGGELPRRYRYSLGDDLNYAEMNFEQGPHDVPMDIESSRLQAPRSCQPSVSGLHPSESLDSTNRIKSTLSHPSSQPVPMNVASSLSASYPSTHIDTLQCNLPTSPKCAALDAQGALEVDGTSALLWAGSTTGEVASTPVGAMRRRQLTAQTGHDYLRTLQHAGGSLDVRRSNADFLTSPKRKMYQEWLPKVTAFSRKATAHVLQVLQPNTSPRSTSGTLADDLVSAIPVEVSTTSTTPGGTHRLIPPSVGRLTPEGVGGYQSSPIEPVFTTDGTTGYIESSSDCLDALVLDAESPVDDSDEDEDEDEAAAEEDERACQLAPLQSHLLPPTTAAARARLLTNLLLPNHESYNPFSPLGGVASAVGPSSNYFTSPSANQPHRFDEMAAAAEMMWLLHPPDQDDDLAEIDRVNQRLAMGAIQVPDEFNRIQQQTPSASCCTNPPLPGASGRNPMMVLLNNTGPGLGGMYRQGDQSNLPVSQSSPNTPEPTPPN